MTSATPNSERRRGFTLLELLLVVGIIATLAAILLPAVTRTWDRAIRIRTQADLAAIAQALDQYKADFNGYYPPVSTADAGAAALCKALLGPADAAHYYTGTPPAVASNVLQNPPDPYTGPPKVYQAGDVVLSGALPSFDDFASGRQQTIFICVRNNTQADGTARTPAGDPLAASPDFWWTQFLPFDGADGNGSRIRLAALLAPNAAGVADVPHAAAGKVYGPYLDVERFKTNGTAILDRWGSPILYFPLTKGANAGQQAAAPFTRGGFVNANHTPRVTASEPLSLVNATDNLGAFGNDAVAGETTANLLAKVSVMLGDYNNNGAADAAEPTPPATPFILWTAGADRIFGPRGKDATVTMNWSLKAQDFYGNPPTAAEIEQNRATSAVVDDVTNFR